MSLYERSLYESELACRAADDPDARRWCARHGNDVIHLSGRLAHEAVVMHCGTDSVNEHNGHVHYAQMGFIMGTIYAQKNHKRWPTMAAMRDGIASLLARLPPGQDKKIPNDIAELQLPPDSGYHFLDQSMVDDLDRLHTLVGSCSNCGKNSSHLYHCAIYVKQPFALDDRTLIVHMPGIWDTVTQLEAEKVQRLRGPPLPTQWQKHARLMSCIKPHPYLQECLPEDLVHFKWSGARELLSKSCHLVPRAPDRTDSLFMWGRALAMSISLMLQAEKFRAAKGYPWSEWNTMAKVHTRIDAWARGAPDVFREFVDTDTCGLEFKIRVDCVMAELECMGELRGKLGDWHDRFHVYNCVFAVVPDAIKPRTSHVVFAVPEIWRIYTPLVDGVTTHKQRELWERERDPLSVRNWYKDFADEDVVHVTRAFYTMTLRAIGYDDNRVSGWHTRLARALNIMRLWNTIEPRATWSLADVLQAMAQRWPGDSSRDSSSDSLDRSARVQLLSHQHVDVVDPESDAALTLTAQHMTHLAQLQLDVLQLDVGNETPTNVFYCQCAVMEGWRAVFVMPNIWLLDYN
jgi:hypothetical protein